MSQRRDWQDAIQGVIQSVALLVPGLSEIRLVLSRVLAFLRAWHYLARAGLTGDYLEFGVYRGLSFSLALRCASRYFRKGRPESPRFFAFDSFQGLPPAGQHDAAVWQQGDYSASVATFRRKIRRAARGWQVEIVPGFFSETLTPEIWDRLRLGQIGFATIDCDLYDSTLQALEFLTPGLQTGSVLYFDDWFFSGGSMVLGEAGACREWLGRHPEITLVDFGQVGIMGQMFLVNIGVRPAG